MRARRFFGLGLVVFVSTWNGPNEVDAEQPHVFVEKQIGGLRGLLMKLNASPQPAGWSRIFEVKGRVYDSFFHRPSELWGLDVTSTLGRHMIHMVRCRLLCLTDNRPERRLGVAARDGDWVCPSKRVLSHIIHPLDLSELTCNSQETSITIHCYRQ